MKVDYGSFRVVVAGREVDVDVRQSDIVRTEEQTGKPIGDLGAGLQTLMRIAWNGCRRQGVAVSDDFYEFVDAVEIADVTGVDLAGKGSSPAQPIG